MCYVCRRSNGNVRITVVEINDLSIKVCGTCWRNHLWRRLFN